LSLNWTNTIRYKIMWFKQIQLFQFPSNTRFIADNLAKQLEPFLFQPCLPSHASSLGWVPPLENDQGEGPLVKTINHYMMICLQIEEKILPSTVIRQELAKKVKQIEIEENRKIRSKEKLNFKDEITFTLLPRAFSKFTKLYGYIDTQTQQLIIATTNAKKKPSTLFLS